MVHDQGLARDNYMPTLMYNPALGCTIYCSIKDDAVEQAARTRIGEDKYKMSKKSQSFNIGQNFVNILYQ